MDCNLYEYYKNKGGGSNGTKTNNTPLSIEKIRNIGFDLLEAVNYMHSKGIFHRDIKP